MAELVRRELRRTAAGGIADSIWANLGTLEVHRTPPLRSRSGKLLPLEVQARRGRSLDAGTE